MRRAPVPSMLATVCLAVLLVACGGDKKDKTPIQGSMLLGSEPLDGSVNGNGVIDINDDAVAGDNVGNAEVRGFISFDISVIPAGAQIVEAILTVTQNAVAGDPYGLWGPCEIDHVTLGGALDAGDFTGGSLNLNIGPISTDASLSAKTLNVTAQVALDITQGRSFTDFRLHFNGMPGSNADGVEDSARFGTSLGPNVPTLEVTYLTFPP